MSTTTEKLGLIKPELSDPADITAMNNNWDKLDENIGKLGTVLFNESKTSLMGVTVPNLSSYKMLAIYITVQRQGSSTTSKGVINVYKGVVNDTTFSGCGVTQTDTTAIGMLQLQFMVNPDNPDQISLCPGGLGHSFMVTTGGTAGQISIKTYDRIIGIY